MSIIRIKLRDTGKSRSEIKGKYIAYWGAMLIIFNFIMEGFSMRKSNKKGFTLVELVVVIAIIGVLAAILIPTMMNYVKKARLKTANSNAKLVFTTVNNKCADIVSDGDACDGLQWNTPVDVSTKSSATDVVEKAVYEALKDNGDGIGWAVVDYKTADDATGNFAQWQTNGTATKQITGQFPDPCKEVSDAEDLTFGTYANKN